MADVKKMQVKLFIDKKTQEVVFAEVGKGFVDFLYTLLHIPITYLVRLLSESERSSLGCFTKLYQSIQNMDESYLQPNVNKTSILNPDTVPTLFSSLYGLLKVDTLFPQLNTFYRCLGRNSQPSYYGNSPCPNPNYFTDSNESKCPSCHQSFTVKLNLVSQGYVKDFTTYIVMSDLRVITATTIVPILDVLTSSNITDIQALESKDVEFSIDDGLKLLEASLCSKHALTYAFLGKNEVSYADSHFSVSAVEPTKCKKLKLRLLVDKKSETVLFAEAGKDFIDFLYTLLCIPLVDIFSFLTEDSNLGSLATLYKSIHTMDATYFQSTASKNSILKPPKLSNTISPTVLEFFPLEIFATTPDLFYRCQSYCNNNITTNQNMTCPICKGVMAVGLTRHPVNNKTSNAEGYVKDTLYMVMDDLTVSPATMISTIALLNANNVKEFESLESKEVEFSINEALKLIEASFCSESSLTYLFLGKKLKRYGSNESQSPDHFNLFGGEMVKKIKEWGKI